jgi:hypothetical protein
MSARLATVVLRRLAGAAAATRFFTAGRESASAVRLPLPAARAGGLPVLPRAVRVPRESA